MDPVLHRPQLRRLAPALLARFAVVGLSGAAVYYALLWSLVELGGVPPLGASSIAFVLVVGENYLLHRRWTFASRAAHRQALPRFALMACCGGALNGAVMGGCLRLGLHYLLAQALALLAVVSCNLVGTLLIFFAGGPEDAAP